MVTALLHRVNFGRGTVATLLTDEPVEKALNRFLVKWPSLKPEWIEWIETREITLTANKRDVSPHELTKFL
jgi:hypothetical protein